MRRLHLSFLIILFASTHSLAQSPTKLRVLFIGNSLTYSNDLPSIVAAIAKATKQRTFEHKTIALPDYSLEDHWNSGEARKEIAKAKWDFVVLQQGPSSLPESRVLLREYAKKFALEIKRAGAKPAVYMVWPSISRHGDFDRVIESHQLAAADIDGILLPVSVAWRATLKDLKLYSADNFHPSELGSFLAAWVIFKRLYSNPKVPMPSSFKIDSRTISLSNSQLTQLTRAADEALK